MNTTDSMYTTLFNGISDALTALTEPSNNINLKIIKAVNILTRVQQKADNMYIEQKRN